MENNVLTFREWSENFVEVHYKLDLFEVKLISFGYLVDDVYEREKVKEIISNEKKYLLKYYKENFDKIQQQHLDNMEIIS